MPWRVENDITAALDVALLLAAMWVAGIRKPKHDVWLVAVATGPGIDKPYWPTANPYQPASPEWRSYVLGVTGAVRVDADGSGKFESAFDYAERIVERQATATSPSRRGIKGARSGDCRAGSEPVDARARRAAPSRAGWRLPPDTASQVREGFGDLFASGS